MLLLFQSKRTPFFFPRGPKGHSRVGAKSIKDYIVFTNPEFAYLDHGLTDKLRRKVRGGPIPILPCLHREVVRGIILIKSNILDV